jgi:hypothetical protein
VVASETKKWPFFARRSRFLQTVAVLLSKKSAQYGGKWAFLGQTACHLTSYKTTKSGLLAAEFHKMVEKYIRFDWAEKKMLRDKKTSVSLKASFPNY